MTAAQLHRRARLVILPLAIGILTLAASPSLRSPLSASRSRLQVYFSPRGGCQPAILAALDAARREIRVQAYAFTSVPIAGALVAARARGVDVRAILDKPQAADPRSMSRVLAAHDVPVLLDARHAIAHNKIIVIDTAIVITGSFNFTAAAEEANAENLLIIRDAPLAAKYLTNWLTHASHAAVYTNRAAVRSVSSVGSK